VLGAGDKASDFTLHTVDDVPISLSDTFQTARSTLLVFLRHLG
jgi:peroxiredoxin